MAKKLLLGPILAPLDKFTPLPFFSWILHLLDVRHSCKIPNALHAISRKIYQPNLRKWKKKTSFGPSFGPFDPNSGCQINLAPLVTRYYGQLSPYTISDKTNDSILRKLSYGRTDGQTYGQMDKSDCVGRCQTNNEHPKN